MNGNCYKKNILLIYMSISEKTLSVTIKGIFLLILTVASNFNAETLGCKTQYALTNNMYVKNLLNLALIYFAINLTNDDTNLEHPTVIMKRTIVVWLGFLIFTKMNILFTAGILILLIVGYTLGNYIDYYNQNNEHDKAMKTTKIRKIIFNIIPIALIIGVITYYIAKKKEYKKFNVLTFLFGKIKCRNN